VIGSYSVPNALEQDVLERDAAYDSVRYLVGARSVNA